MRSKPETVLVLAPHTDDAEFGCGATINRLVEEGAEVTCVAFSAAEKNVPSDWPRDILRTEVQLAGTRLGVSGDHLKVLSYPVREFVQHRQALLDDMIRLRDDLSPELVLMPSVHDTHQDHQVIAEEGFRAFKATTIMGYELPWNTLTFSTTSFQILDERHVQAKVEAVKCYASQASRNYASEEFVRSLCRVRGVQIGVQYAEAFEVIRWVRR